MSRYMTHVKRLTNVPYYSKRFFETLEPLARAGKLGPVLWQFPDNFHRNDERLEAALKALPKGRHAFEFRHPSWFDPETYALLRKHSVALVIGDDPERPFQTHERTAPWTLIRFHRGSQGRKGNYSKAEIETWARRIAQWRRKSEVFAYFNNDFQAFGPTNAQLLRKSFS